MSGYATVQVTSAQLGEHLGGVRDLVQQLGDLLSNPAPGGIVARREELLGMIQQAQQLVSEAESQLETINGLTGLLTQHLSTLVGALETSGVTRVTFSGPAATVRAEHAAAMGGIGGSGVLHGFTLVAATPDARQALAGIVGVGEALAR